MKKSIGIIASAMALMGLGATEKIATEHNIRKRPARAEVKDFDTKPRSNRHQFASLANNQRKRRKAIRQNPALLNKYKRK